MKNPFNEGCECGRESSDFHGNVPKNQYIELSVDDKYLSFNLFMIACISSPEKLPGSRWS
jgi:hypothetical protein